VLYRQFLPNNDGQAWLESFCLFSDADVDSEELPKYYSNAYVIATSLPIKYQQGRTCYRY